MEEHHFALALHVFYGYAIDTSCASIPAHFTPGPPQNIGPENAVVERMEPSIPAPLAAKYSLRWSCRELSKGVVGPDPAGPCTITYLLAGHG